MRIYLSDNVKLTKFDLPTETEDFFSYSYIIPRTSSSCLITFEKKDNKWYLKSNGAVNAYKDNMVYESVEIFEYSSYKLKVIGYNDFINIYFMSFETEELLKFDLSNITNISLGNNEKTNICYYNNTIAPIHATISKEADGWYIKSIEDLKFYTYVNCFRIIRKKLYAGDIIFINGLKIVWMQKFFAINNLHNKLRISGINSYSLVSPMNKVECSPVSDEQKNVKLYSEDEIFFHTPRIMEVIDNVEIQIDPPPGGETERDQPLWITIGSSITMGASSLMMGWNVGYGLTSGTMKPITAIPQAIMCGVMIFGSLVMPKLTDKYQKSQLKKREAKRVLKYTNYLNEKDKAIEFAMKKHAQILRDNSLSANSCKGIVTNQSNRNFWCREIADEDFLLINLGQGNINNTVKIQGPTEKFTIEEDGLLRNVLDLEEKYKKLNDVPIKISLVEKRISAFVCEDKIRNIYLDNLILQLVTLHSGADLKIVIFTNENNQDRWSYFKYLPHCFDEEKKMRFFVTNTEDAKEVSAALETEYNRRKAILKAPEQNVSASEAEKIKQEKEYKNFSTYYLIISDNYKNNMNIPIIKTILEDTDKNYGFSFSVFTNTLKNLPPQCNTFIQIGTKDGAILERNISSSNQQVFNLELETGVNMRQISNFLINVPFAAKEGTQILPTSLSFLDMYGVSKIEQLNISNRWKTNNPVNSLSATIGVYANGDEFKLNLHEKFHGPHGLIAGMTGSGKSEFIITYILSMCVNYHPYEVQFVLIDYKGGGLAGAFQNKETGVKIPHLVGTITNLDTASMNRTLVSITSELKRRQKIFNETKDMLGESTIDIYKYQRFYREGAVKEPMAHLFIISDEFAELKAQQPEFMQELISTARIGRSLGVHLILATQKPSGVVNDQIWSNSKFKVCLKVQDRGDSMEMLKKPDAASIKETGRFYLQVGYDDFFDVGQSGWAGAKYVPSDKILKKIDDSINFIDNIGTVFKTAREITINNVETEDLGDQLTNIVKTIYNIGKKNNLNPKGLWLEPIPEYVFIEDLKKKYNYKPSPYFINPVIGEYDNPSEQQQGLLNIDISNNTMIWGQVGSGKENLVSTIIWSCCFEHTPEEINFYIIDCGTEVLKKFEKMPHVGDVATSDDNEKVLNTLTMIENEIEKRKDIMSEFGGTYKDYLENSGNKLPIIAVIINNYEIFSETYSKLADNIMNLYRDGFKYGVVFIVTAIGTNTVRMKMLQNFSNKLCLQVPNDSYRDVVPAKKGLVPSKLFGRGLVERNGTAYEFQTAIFSTKKDFNKYIAAASTQLSNYYKIKAKPVLVMPDIVLEDSLEGYIQDLTNVPIGVEMETIEPFKYDFTSKKFTSIISSELNGEQLSFIKILIDYCKKIPNIIVNVLDFEEVFKSVFENDENYYSENFDNAIMNINNKIIQNKDSNIKTITIIICAGEIKEKLSNNGLVIMNNLFNNVASIDNSYYVFIDSLDSMKKIQTEIWYQNSVDKNSGIWLGQGIADQLLINVNNVSLEHKKLKFNCLAFVINNGEYNIIKHVSERR